MVSSAISNPACNNNCSLGLFIPVHQLDGYIFAYWALAFAANTIKK